MKKSRVVIITVIVTLVVISVIGVLIKAKSGSEGNPTLVRIEKARHGELIEFVSAPGEIEPKTKVELSAKVSARIIELPFEEGDVVTCGKTDTNPPVPPSVLVRLDGGIWRVSYCRLRPATLLRLPSSKLKKQGLPASKPILRDLLLS